MYRFSLAGQQASLQNFAASATYVGLLTEYSADGSTEVSDDDYSRQPISWKAIGDDVILKNDDLIAIDVPRNTTVKYLGLWNGASASAGPSATYMATIPLGSPTAEFFRLQGASATYIGDTSDFEDDDVVVPFRDSNSTNSEFLTATGMSEGDEVYVINKQSQPDSLQLSATQGGSPFTPTTQGEPIILTKPDFFTTTGPGRLNILPYELEISFGYPRPEVVRSVASDGAFTTSVTVDFSDLDLQVGDLIIAAHAKDDNDTTQYTGFNCNHPSFARLAVIESSTNLDSEVMFWFCSLTDDDINDATYGLYSRDVTFTHNETGESSHVLAIQIRGAAAGNPIDHFMGTPGNDPESATPDFTAITPVRGGCGILNILNSDESATSSMTPPDGTTKVAELLGGEMNTAFAWLRDGEGEPLSRSEVSPGAWTFSDSGAPISISIAIASKGTETPWEELVNSLDPYAWWELNYTELPTYGTGTNIGFLMHDSSSNENRATYNSFGGVDFRAPGVPGLGSGVGVLLTNYNSHGLTTANTYGGSFSSMWSGSWCFGYWVKFGPTANKSTEVIFVRRLASFDGLQVSFNYNSGAEPGAISFWYETTGVDANALAVSSLDYSDGRWHLLMFEYDDPTDTQHLWLDGVQVGSRDGTGITRPGSLSTYMSVAGVNNQKANIYVDECIFFDKTLSTEEHEALYAAYKGT